MFYFPFNTFLLPVGVVAFVFILFSRFIRSIRDSKKADENQYYEDTIRLYVREHEHIEDPDFWNRFVLRNAYQNKDTIFHITNVIRSTSMDVWCRISLPDFPSESQKKEFENKYGIPIRGGSTASTYK